LKRRPRILPDNSQVVIYPASGPSEPLCFERAGSGVALRGVWTSSPEGQRPPGASIVLLSTGRTLCRNIELPDASDSQLETALRLQIEALQLGSVPEHRTGAVVLPREMAAEGRIGLSVEWPGAEPVPSTPRDLPPDGDPLFAGDASVLVALAHAGLQGPLVLASEDRRALTFAFRAPKGLVVRSSRLDPAEWPAGAETAVLESALRAGSDAAGMRALLGQLREALANAGESGLGCTSADLDRLPDITGIAEESEWWRVHGPSVGAALAWFGPLRPLVSLRAQPKGERPSRFGEWMNRLEDPALATRLLVAALITIALAPPIVSGARLLLLRWKVGDLAAREQANLAHRQRVSMYSELQRRAWPMTKLLGDLACVTPEGVEWESVNMSQDRNIMIQGFARPHDNLNGTEVLLKMERQLRDSRVFDRVQRKWDAPDGKGTVRFQISASVARATQRPNYSSEQDFGKKTLSERRYGPEKPDTTETASDAATAPPDPASLPSEPSLGEPAAEVAAATTSEGGAKPSEKSTPTGKRATTAASKPSSKVAKTERRSGSDTIASGGANEASAEAGSDADDKSGRGSRRSSASAGSTPGLARRSERNPGSSDAEFKAPEPLSDAAIAAMTTEEIKSTLSKVSEARNRIPKDDTETQTRLKAEFNKLMARLRGGGS
jgi:hypothetical protein